MLPKSAWNIRDQNLMIDCFCGKKHQATEHWDKRGQYHGIVMDCNGVLLPVHDDWLRKARNEK